MRIIYHERYLEHRQDGPWHPESPRRLERVIERLKAEGLWGDPLVPEPSSREDCLRVHHESYLDHLRNFGEGHWDADTYVRPETYPIALLAAGGAILAARHAFASGEPTLALLRPPGHHAHADNAMGFCYLNNPSIATASLLAEGAERVAIVDLDVHHGSGTSKSFYSSPQVLYCSLHQWPLYPGTGWLDEIGEGAGRGYTVNVPLPPGSGDVTYFEALDRLIVPIVERFRPSLLMVLLGTDAHRADPLGAMHLTSAGYVKLMGKMWKLAVQVCGGRFACLLEGGYDPDSLAEVVAATAAQLAGGEIQVPKETSDPKACGRGRVLQVVKQLNPYWNLTK